MSSGRVFRFTPAKEQPAHHLFVFLHGCGATAQSMIPIAFKFQARFPTAALVVPSGFDPDARGGAAQDWYPTRGLHCDNHGERVAAVLPDFEDLVRREQPRRHAGEGLRVGHVHLHVGDLEQALGFYQGVLGFDLMTRYPGALFLSAGGYHHHVGVNTWRGEGVGPAPAGTVGLREWTIVHEEAEDGALRRDPWGIAVRLRRGS